jgi:hypothetical protein
MLFSVIALVCLSTVAIAIDPGAPSASHHMEEAAEELHEYLHDNYTTSYGAHGLENAAVLCHDTLHDWSNGNATEDATQATFDALKVALNSFKDTAEGAGILDAGDDELDDLVKEAKDAFKALKTLMK